jgi:hypothetical protein
MYGPAASLNFKIFLQVQEEMQGTLSINSYSSINRHAPILPNRIRHSKRFRICFLKVRDRSKTKTFKHLHKTNMPLCMRKTRIKRDNVYLSPMQEGVTNSSVLRACENKRLNFKVNAISKPKLESR